MADLDVPIALRRARRSSSRGTGNAGMTTTESVKKQRDDMDTDAESDSDTRATKKLHTLPPQTPRRRTRQKIVHFPDGQEATQTDNFLSSGLTPMIRRTSIQFSGQQRRQANGNSSSSSKHLSKKRERRDTTPFSRSLGQIRALSTSSTAKVPSYNVFEAPRQHRTVDGRVERRIRRNNTRLLVNKVEQEKRRKTWEAQKEIRHLRSEIQSRDREIYQYQNATMVMDTERIWHLEGQIEQLKRELLAKEEAAAAPSVTMTGYPDPKGGHVARHERRAPIGEDGFSDEDLDTVANQGDDEPEDCGFDDGYDGGYDDDDDLIGTHHDGHGTDMSQFVARTPSSRPRSSFPTPPATSPTVPASPCVVSRSQNRLPACPSCPTVLQQAREHKAEELASLQLEVAKLTATLDSYKNMASRLKEQLAAVDLPPCSSPLSAPPSSFPGGNDASSSSSSSSTAKVLEGKVAALLQDMSDRTASIAHLTTSIARLGFPGANTDEMMGALATGFRAARLELEYLTPGEISLPLTLHGAEVLDLLLVRLRELAKRAQEDEACIDEYHETEQSLRKQLDARVTIMDELRGKVAAAEQQLEAQHVANQRLRGAVDGYVRDMSELEKLVERMEQDHGAQCEERDASIRELERRLADAVRHTTSLQREMSDVQDSTTRHVVALNKRHGKALALSDARVLELRGELDRVNHSLRAAHETICGLRVETGRLQTERDVAREAMDSIKTELQRVLQMGGGVGGGGGGGNGGGGSSTKSLTTTSSSSCCCVNAVAAKSRRDPLQDELASSSPSSSLSTTVGVGRRSSNGGGGNKKRRRRYDSGLGLLDEEEADMF
ncbi:hypothetical protein AAL_06084 [Moelleriella libera RCEF 2490]|uniref:Uncharacterized protein n=1 Tax=Moelleriella libera RCEF 2490 TaxID=1081109 RepID=A0A167ZBY3_9HYPO|nr:hypothetical protein AAL_06084 [Moelleriella libera RCEF 2490]